jgi:hypothetical protein
MPLVNLKKNFDSFPSIFARIRCSNIFAVTEHTRNQNFLVSYQEFFFSKIFTLVLLDGVLDGFSKFWFFIIKICILIWYFWAIFENYSMHMLSIRGNDFITHWAYKETISLHTQHTRNKFRACSASGKMWTVFTCTSMLSIRRTNFIAHWAYAEWISSHTEHTRNGFHCWLSICGNV